MPSRFHTQLRSELATPVLFVGPPTAKISQTLRHKLVQIGEIEIGA